MILVDMLKSMRTVPGLVQFYHWTYCHDLRWHPVHSRLGSRRNDEPFLLAPLASVASWSMCLDCGLMNTGGLLYYNYQGITDVIYSALIFLGSGAMTDFGPLIAQIRVRLYRRSRRILVIFIALIEQSLSVLICRSGCHRHYAGADGSHGNL